MTVDEAKNLTLGKVLYHKTFRNADGTPHRWRVNGKPKTWKRNPNRVRVPLKRGLYEFWELTADNAERFALDEEAALSTSAIGTH